MNPRTLDALVRQSSPDVALLSRIEQAGIPAVEIYCARQHLDYREKAQVAELGYWFRDSQIKLHALHAPMYTDEIWGRSGPHAVISITEPVKGRRLEMVDEIKRALDIAEVVPSGTCAAHRRRRRGSSTCASSTRPSPRSKS